MSLLPPLSRLGSRFTPLTRGLHLLYLCRQIGDYPTLDRVPRRLLEQLGVDRQG